MVMAKGILLLSTLIMLVIAIKFLLDTLAPVMYPPKHVRLKKSVAAGAVFFLLLSLTYFMW